ncbi:MAG: amidohydrolase family protein [Niabella sp.]
MANINRRNFVKNTATALSGMAFASVANGGGKKAIENSITEDYAEQQYDLMKEVKKYRKIDSHVHVLLGKLGPEDNNDFCDRLSIDRMYISRPVTNGIGSGKGMPDDFINSNDLMVQAMKKYPGRMVGMFTLNPQYPKESLEEIKRCVDMGMVGLKVYYQVKINNPLFYPIIEKMIDLKMIILMHAEATLGTGGYRMKYDAKRMPNTSTPEDFVDIAKRYPEAMFQYAHLGGGPDWEYACKVLKNSPNVYVDTSGSNNAENMVDFAVKTLGEDRVFFGTDNMYFQGVGKVLCSELTESQKQKIFFENYNNVLRKGGYHVN